MVWKGCVMKIEIDIPSYDYEVLTNISDYVNIDINKLCTDLVINHIREFDKAMTEYLEQSLLIDYYE